MVTLFHAAVLGSLVLPAQPPAALPGDWHGTWAGMMTITPEAAPPTQVSMKLTIEPIENGYRWKTSYDEGGKKPVVKDYLLLPDPKRPGRYLLDEQNGIILDSRLINGVLYSQFVVGGRLFNARYELRDKALRFELTATGPAQKTGGQAKVPPVTVFPVQVVQTAELKREPQPRPDLSR